MGNKNIKSNSTSQDLTVLKTYQELISRDFDDKISMIAAKKYPTNLRMAINYILETNDKLEKQTKSKQAIISQVNQQQNQDCKSHSNKETANSTEDISSCQSLQRLTYVLKLYKIQNCNFDNTNYKQIEEYFTANANKIINDYHHVLHEHLNEDYLSKIESDEQLKYI
eukprot:225676_1